MNADAVFTKVICFVTNRFSNLDMFTRLGRDSRVSENVHTYSDNFNGIHNGY